MSFADSMDDLEAMNDPRNTAESMAARRSAAKPRGLRALFAWLPLMKKVSARPLPAPQAPIRPRAEDLELARQQVIADLNHAMNTSSSVAPASDRKVS